jgi:hypothetical protein
MIEPQDLRRIEAALEAGAESVVVPTEILEDLLEMAREMLARPPARFSPGDQVGVDPRHSGVALSHGIVTQVWADEEPVYEVLLRYAGGTRMLYREGELLPERAGATESPRPRPTSGTSLYGHGRNDGR